MSPMRPSKSLRSRILLAYMMLAGVLCFLFGAVTYISVEAIEVQQVNGRLLESGNQMIENHLNGYHTGPNEPEVLVGEQIPDSLRRATPGIHEVVEQDRSLHVLIRDYEGKRYAIVYDESGFERIETYVLIALSAACLVSLVAAFLLASATASRVIRPVTELANAVREDQLVAGLEALEADDEVGVLARAFATKSEEMQRFLLREQLFTGDVSHELRTPLTVVLGAAELLQARLGDRPDLLPAIERIRRTAADTAERVSALLLLSRSPESMDAPLLDLEPLVAHEMERCRPLLQGKPVSMRLEVRQAARVFGRAELAATAIGNLVRNACQFTEQGEVLLVLDRDTLVIEDTGGGVPEVVRTRVFDRYIRAAPDHITGTGLGLAIVRRIAEHLGWTVVHEARLDGGSRFIVTFPHIGDTSTA
ncbi:sensor histidine kinase [Delftia tsuruhatensis]|uniref:sensor histidine kinase n=1 Tax=Delftia tsuruhatensis TaxID=180282 RepID=UPI0023DCBA6B|nr:HAMP domain-containing sensor histidine kinase [Delftia tsuruhatensis]WEL99001.1 HAMP domain-containing sensor histidine kinase [Delftia tsuruhatensis]